MGSILKFGTLGAKGLGAISLTVFLSGSIAASFAPYLSILATQSFRLSPNEFAVMLALGAITELFASFYFGLKTDHSGKRRFTSLVLSTLTFFGALLLTIQPDKPIFFLVHAIVWPISGAISGQLLAMANRCTTDWDSFDKDKAFAYIRAVLALPFILLPLLWSWLLQSDWEITSVYPFSAFIALGIFIVCLKGLPSDIAPSKKMPDARNLIDSFKPSLTRIALLRVFFLSMLTVGPGLYLLAVGLVFIEIEERNASDVGSFVALISFLEIPLMIIFPLLLKFLTKPELLAVGSAIYAVFLFSFVKMAASEYLYLSAIMGAAGAAIILTIPIAYLQEAMTDTPGVAGAFLTTIGTISGLINALILAMVSAYDGILVIGIVGGIVVLIGGAGILILERCNTISAGAS